MAIRSSTRGGSYMINRQKTNNLLLALPNHELLVFSLLYKGNIFHHGYFGIVINNEMRMSDIIRYLLDNYMDFFDHFVNFDNLNFYFNNNKLVFEHANYITLLDLYDPKAENVLLVEVFHLYNEEDAVCFNSSSIEAVKTRYVRFIGYDLEI